MKRLLLAAPLLILASWISTSAQNAEATFVEYRIKDVGTIMIPTTMELQSGSYKEYSVAASKQMMSSIGYDISPDEAIFQQKGLNEGKGNYSYARVMIATSIGSIGDNLKLTTKLKLTPAELRQIDSTIKNQTVASTSGFGIKILRWDGSSIVTIGTRTALRTAYLRQLEDKPSVYVEVYQFMNNDRMHTLTISYRQQDESMWKADLERTRNSFVISNIR